MERKLKKIERAAALLADNLGCLKCPHCGSGFEEVSNHGIVCPNRHRFDLSKKGYLNLLKQNHKTLYDNELFVSRQKIYGAGLYEPLLEEIFHLLDGMTLESASKILDAGSGEGYFVNELAQKIKGSLFGLDISKEGIGIATQREEDVTWCVGDLSQLPFQDGTWDVILNILSPANYLEFQRTMKKNGFLVKVIPGPSYLKEIREALKGKIRNETYSNEDVIKGFQDKLHLTNLRTIKYKKNIDPALFPSLIQMTPLTAHLNDQDFQSLLKADISEITIELTILAGQFIS